MEKQFVIFKLDQEYYGLDIHQVESIIKIQAITKLPQSLSYVKGIINLRGKVIPVLNLRDRLGLSDTPEDHHTRIIITRSSNLKVFSGLIVDQVNEVLHLETETFEDVPDITTTVHQKYIQAVAKHEQRLIILLDLQTILAEEEAPLLAA